MAPAPDQPLRSQILTTDSPWIRAARITIDAPAQAVFDVLADPRRHAEFDGSATVLSAVRAPDRLALGSQFSMSMRIRLPYVVQNTVVEFEEGRRIAWRHFGGHRWRYRLEPVDDSTTIVTEEFDATTALSPRALRLMNAYVNNEKAIAKTLVRLKRLVESGIQP